MNTFDMGKNLHVHRFLSAIIVGKQVMQNLRENTEPSDAAVIPPFATRIEVIEDATERKMRAMLLSMTTGAPVLFEGENGEWLEASNAQAKQHVHDHADLRALQS